MSQAENPVVEPCGIMVVDNDIRISELLSLIFQNTHRVRCCNSVQQAREALKVGVCFDKVLLDIQLPDGNGMTFAAEIKKQCPNAKIAIVSAYIDSSTEVEDRLMQLQSDGTVSQVIAKPFDLRTIEAFVDENRGSERF